MTTPWAGISSGAGVLTVVATPIGNLGDLSPRAAEAIVKAELVCCEDTRTTGRLLALTGLESGKLVALHEHNERERSAEIVDRLIAGAAVALVCDAGTPLVSDPGSRLVRLAVDAGVQVVAVPGPSAVLAALVVSGLGGGRFRFEGFLPRKGAERKDRIAAVASSSDPTVIYEAPGRVAETAMDLGVACGAERLVSISRELTKLHEESWRGVLGDATDTPVVKAARGEYVLVIDGASPSDAPTELDGPLTSLAEVGLTRSQAVAALETLLQIAHRTAYDAVLAHPGFARSR